MLEQVRTVGPSGDLQLIVATERAIVEGDLLRYANNQEMAKSLATALSELAAVEKHMALVADPARYRTVNEAHSLPRNRKSGLPYDEARQAMASHGTQLGNMDKSRLTADKKAIITDRKENVTTARALRGNAGQCHRYILLEATLSSSEMC